jgi:hypothetical protein
MVFGGKEATPEGPGYCSNSGVTLVEDAGLGRAVAAKLDICYLGIKAIFRH